MNPYAINARLFNAAGLMLTVIPESGFLGVSYTLKDNEPGVLDIELPGDFPASYLMEDGQFEIEYSISGTPKVEGETGWFIRRIQKAKNKAGESVYAVTAFSALHIIKRRYITYYAGSSYSEKVAEHWDDMLREFVRENYGSLAQDPARNLSPWLIIQSDISQGISYQKAGPWRPIADVIQEVVEDIRGKGTICTYDVVRGATQGTYEFRIYIGPRGMDHRYSTSNPVIISESRRNLIQPKIDLDWQTEATAVYAAGQGEEADRTIKLALDQSRINVSPFNRIEFVQEARMASKDETVEAEAYAALQLRRPRKIFTGKISQTEGCIYNYHWGWGDLVTAEYEGEFFDCYIDTVTVSIAQDGTKQATGNLRSIANV